MNEQKCDWIYLPDGEQSISLWVSLHDAHLQTIHSDRLARTIELTFRIPHLIKFYYLPEQLTFTMSFSEVSSVRCINFAPWPGDFIKPSNATREELVQAIEEFQHKGREQSVDWVSFEQSLLDEHSCLLISNAELVTAESTTLLKFECFRDGDDWHECIIRAGLVVIRDSADKVYGVDQFLRLGGEYWQAFGKR